MLEMINPESYLWNMTIILNYLLRLSIAGSILWMLYKITKINGEWKLHFAKMFTFFFALGTIELIVSACEFIFFFVGGIQVMAPEDLRLFLYWTFLSALWRIAAFLLVRHIFISKTKETDWLWDHLHI